MYTKTKIVLVLIELKAKSVAIIDVIVLCFLCMKQKSKEQEEDCFFHVFVLKCLKKANCFFQDLSLSLLYSFSMALVSLNKYTEA